MASSKRIPVVALINVDSHSQSTLADCFRQFGIETTLIKEEPEQRLMREKLEGCVLRLEDGSLPILEAIRKSPSNKRIFVYGIAPNGAGSPAVSKFLKFGISAIFHEPLERQATLKIVRANHLLILHELRRYVRVPVVMEVQVEALGGKTMIGWSNEISVGGMSLKISQSASFDKGAQLSFSLPEKPRTSIRATLCWFREADQTYGFRFEAKPEQISPVREWIENYLEEIPKDHPR